MILKKLKKLFEKIKKPKKEPIEEIKTLTNKEFSVSSNESVKYEITGTENKTTIIPILEPEPEPVIEVKFFDVKNCNNCEIPMIEKTVNIKHRRKNSPIRKCLVCTKCGFEKRLS